MRIAIVAPLVAPILAVEARGNHHLIADLARGLQRLGHDVTVHAAEGSTIPGVRVATVPVGPDVGGAYVVPGRRFAAAGGMRDAFRRLLDAIDADAVSQHAFDIEAIDLTEDLPAVHTLHLPPIVPAVVEAVRRSGNPLIAVSRSSAALWMRATGRSASVVANEVPDLLGSDAERFLARAPAPTAVIAGRISPEKGTAVAIAAARRSGLRPLVVGSVYDRAYFEDDVRPLLGHAAAVPRPVTRRRLAELMARATALLMPVAWDEPFGLVAAEAQLAGCPVVGYRRGALPEVVSDARSGRLVDPGNEAALVAALAEVGRLDRAAIRERARARLSTGAMARGYESLLRGVAGDASHGPWPGVPVRPSGGAGRAVAGPSIRQSAGQ